jgi:hypothetical protein
MGASPSGTMRHEHRHTRSRTLQLQIAKQFLAFSRTTVTVEIVDGEPQALATETPVFILGSTGKPCRPCLDIVIAPVPFRRPLAMHWARESFGAGLVADVCDHLLPAHVGFRLRYRVPASRGNSIVTDTLRFGQARLGFTFKETASVRKYPPLDAVAQMLLKHIMASFDLDEADPRWDAIYEEHRRRRADRFGELLPADLSARIEALEELQQQRLKVRSPRVEKIRNIPLSRNRSK